MPNFSIYMTSDIEEKIEKFLNKIGFDLWDVSFISQKLSYRIVVYIDSTKGIKINDCEYVNKKLNEFFFTEDLIDQHYELEVSSPGVFRSLTKPKHFEKYLGEKIKVKIKNKILDKNVFIGKILIVNKDGIELESLNENISISFSNIKKSFLEVEI